VPASYDASKPWPLVICLHPSGPLDARIYIESMWSTAELKDSAIVYAPEWPGKGRPWWSDRGNLHLTFGGMDIIFQDFNIDRNRIFLDGAGEGGTEVWKLASCFSYMFAGLIIRAGLPPTLEELEENAGEDSSNTTRTMIPSLIQYPFRFRDLHNSQVLFFSVDRLWTGGTGKQDLEDNLNECTQRCEIHEIPGPHIDPNTINTEAAAMAVAVLSFLRKTRRNPYPRVIDWSVKDNNMRRAFWIKSLDEEETWDTTTPPNFQVFLDRKKNRIDITSERIRGFEINLNDLLLDLSRPVTIRGNDQILLFRGQPSRSLARILQAVDRSGDWTDIFPWSVRIDVP